LTAHAIDSDLRRCLEAGMNDYVTKPVNPGALLAAVQRWLPGEPEGAEALGCALLTSPQDVEKSSLKSRTVFDRSSFLQRMMHDRGLARLIIDEFLVDMPVQIVALKELIDRQDAAGAGAQAHRIKGAAANVNAEVLREIAWTMEKAGRENELSALALAMPEMETEFGRLQDVLKTAAL
jgi:HPt (histidine-containing phosphotransfer) domain-containing protein